MFNNKILLITSVIALIALTLVAVFFGNKKRELSPVINAIPSKVSLIIETDDFTYLSHKISKNENLSSILPKMSKSNNFYNDFLFLDSLINSNKKIKQFLNEKTVIISAHSQGRKDIDFLFATGSKDNKKNIDELNSIIKKSAPNSALTNISFAGAEIVKQNISGNKNVFFYTFFEDYFLFSYSEILLQKAIKNINSGASLFSDANFTKLYRQVKNKNDAKIYINYNNFFNSTDGYLNNTFRDKKHILQNFADWTVFDINIKRKEIKLTGHTILKPEMQFLNLFKNVNPKKSNILRILPEKTSAFLSFNIGNGSVYHYKYEDFLASIKQLNDHQIKMASFYSNYKIDEDKYNLYDLTDNEIALVYEDVNKTGKKHNVYILIKIKDKTKTEEFFNKIITEHCSKNNINTDQFKNVFIYSADFKINKLPLKDLPELYYGTFFQNTNAEYYTFIDDFIIFGESISDLECIIESYIMDKTFRRKSQNYKFIKSLPSQSNIFFYTDIFHSLNLYEKILVESKAKKLAKNISSLISVQGPAIQFISDSYPIYTTFSIALQTEEPQTSETVWEVRLDTIIAGKPNIIINHNTEEKEIVIQDAANKLYLIDKSGKIIWTRQLDGKIISNIYQIDYYNNNKLQLLFNTKNKIYCIDRKGNWLETYPIKLKSEATNGLLLIDYDKDKNYRIIIATKNKSVYLYNKEGKIIKGWEFKKTKSNVTGNIKLYQNNNKDYIVFRDKSNIYILNRKGQLRVKPEVNISLSKHSEIFFTSKNSKSKAHFCVTNPSGTIYKIFENGKVEKKNVKTFSNYHYFLYYDINGDNIQDYIFTDNNRTEVYSGLNDKRIFIRNYNKDIKFKPTIYRFSEDDIRIGSVSENMIFLINNSGEMSEGFPLTGSGFFSITIFDQSNEFSLIVGNNDNYLYKYNLK
ncbi:MAG: DUF3352 domain-containing protein [Bacteroidales bacterium]|nr:DUF3352 domain-containing protein [Bacteroidales bacterium]